MSSENEITESVTLETVHNPDQYMFDFKHILTHGKKKVGVLIGAGGPVSINVGTESKWESLIPDIEGLTSQVKDKLDGDELKAFKAVESEIINSNIEIVLSRIRSLAEVIGTAKIHDLDSSGFESLNLNICKSIKQVVSKSLPKGDSPYTMLVSWISGINRKYAIEVFTTNYDLLMEEALENARCPYFDGFSGSKSAFFDPSTISSNNLPARWTRLWKLHGSINWHINADKEVIRTNEDSSGEMVYPSHIKYDQTQSAPYSAMFERLRNFLLEPDSLLITTGFSFADAHITAKLDECLSENPSAAIFAFQYGELSNEKYVVNIAKRRPNLSAYCRDGAVINGVEAKWKTGDLPSKNWLPIRSEYWKDGEFLLGDFVTFGKFLANSGGGKSLIVNDLDSKVDQDE